MKRLLTLLGLFIIAISSFSQTFTVDGFEYKVLSTANKTVELKNGRRNAVAVGDVSVPSTVTYQDCEYTVTSVGIDAFWECKLLTSVSLPSVTSVNRGAFEECNLLSSVSLPSVTSIGNDAFRYCDNLQDIYISDLAKWCNVSGVENLMIEGSSSKNLYVNDVELTDELNIPEGVTTIQPYTFRGLGIKEVTVPSTITSISGLAFDGCSSISKFTVLAKSVPELCNPESLNGVTIFVPAESLEEYKGAEGWKVYGYNILAIGTEGNGDITGTEGNGDINYDITVEAQSDKSSIHLKIGEENLARVVSLKVSGTINSYDIMIMRNKMPALKFLDLSDADILDCDYEYYTGYHSVANRFGAYAIYPGVQELKLPKSLVAIDDYAMQIGTDENYSAPSLSSVTIYDNVKTIGRDAFKGTQLTSVTIPASVTSIAQGAFDNCPNLFTAIFEDGTDPITLYEAFTYDRYYVSLKYLYLGRNVLERRVYSYDYETAIGSDHSESRLSTLELGETVTYLPRGLFGFLECVIPNLIISNSLQNINGALSWRYDRFVGFKNIYIKDVASWCKIEGLKYIMQIKGSKTFYLNGEKIENLEIPEGIESIQERAFWSGDFSTVFVPKSVKSIDERAFENCTNLTTCTLPTNSETESIAQYAFAGCTSLQTMRLPVSVRTIGDYAFQNCTSLAEVKLPSMINNIGDYAFTGCTSLNDVYTYTVEPQEIDQNTFYTYRTATLYVPKFSFYNYFYDTQWSQFLKLVTFDEPYDYIFIDKDLELDEITGSIDGDPDADINPGGGLIVDENTDQSLGDVHIKGDDENIGSIIGGDGNITAENVYIDLMVQANTWYYFCFPFDVDLTKIEKEGSYIFRYFDGDRRAANGYGSGWQDIIGNKLTAGQGYIFRTNTAGQLSICISNPDLSGVTINTTVETYGDANTADDNRNWNFVGNPFTSYYDMNEMDYTAPIMRWNGTSYEAFRPGDDECTFSPFEAFFIQCPNNINQISFDADGRITYHQSQGNGNGHSQAKARKLARLNPDRKLINITFSDGNTTDKTRIVFNNKQQMGYEMECDASKFAVSASVPQIYTMNDDAVKYSINERPVDNGKVKLAYSVPAEGMYTIAVGRMDENVCLYDIQLGITHDFSNGDYVFSTDAGANEGRFLICVANGVDGIDTVKSEEKAKATYDIAGRRVDADAKGIIVTEGRKAIK